MGRKWSMRTYKEGDEEGILELWKAVYPDREYDQAKWLRWWQWMYKDNPAGLGRIWLAEDNGKIVGQYAIVPLKMKVGGETIISSQSLDTMTHPDYRHQKIFESLAKRLYKEAEEDGISIIYGFPNQFSHPGFVKKLGWFDVGSIIIMCRTFNWKNAVKLKVKSKFLQTLLATGASLIFNTGSFMTHKLPVLEGITVKQITHFDDRFNELWTKVSNQYQIMVVRDKNYLNWRYSNPVVDYSIFIGEKANEICGYLVLRHRVLNGIKISRIFDLIALSEDAMHYLVSKAVEDCREKKVDLILYHLIANKIYQGIFNRNGFISLPFIKGGHFCVYSSSRSVSRQFLINHENWLVQTGDSDLV